MHIDPKSADERLSSPSNIVSRFARVVKVPVESGQSESGPSATQEGKVTEITLGRPGRDTGSHNLPPFIRDTVALLSRAGEKQKPLAKEFGLSQPHVSNLETGKTPTSSAVQEKLDEVRDRALDKLMTSMGLISDEKLEKCKASELSNIAANMSRVVEKVLPREAERGAQIQLIIYKPELRSETSFQSVEV